MSVHPLAPPFPGLSARNIVRVHLFQLALEGSQSVAGILRRLSIPAAELDNCNYCAGLGWFGIDPQLPVNTRPGSREKIAMLTVRYASGVPLWNDEDGLSSADDAADDAADTRRLAL